MTNAQRLARNAEHLGNLYAPVRAKAAYLLSRLEDYGWQPLVTDSYRTPAAQLACYKAGTSRRTYGAHNVTGKGTRPESLALDVVHYPAMWASPTAFWLDLYRIARSLGFTSGAEWGLTAQEKSALRAAAAAAYGNNDPIWVRLGWDCPHVQAMSTTVPFALVKAGWRPKQ